MYSKRLVVSMILVVFLMVSIAPALADSAPPVCEDTYIPPDCSSGVCIGSSRQPLCDIGWSGEVATTYVDPVESSLGFTVTAGGLARIMDSNYIDLSGEANWIHWERFEGSYAFYIVGTQINWGPGSSSDTCGIIFRETDHDNYYIVDINRNGYLRYQEKYHDVWQDATWTQQSAIYTGRRDTNQLTLAVFHSKFFVFINGQHVATYEDTSHTDEAGSVGVEMNAFDSSPTAYCQFSNVWIYQMDNWRLD